MNAAASMDSLITYFPIRQVMKVDHIFFHVFHPFLNLILPSSMFESS
jgi:hypothetical protein